jgi:hypothetical protein
MALDPAAIDHVRALAVGFAAAGLIANFFEFATARRASFGLLETGDLKALACVPVLVFSAPFIIVRNTIRGRRLEARPLAFVMLATMVACGWSLLSGRVVLDLAQAVAGA